MRVKLRLLVMLWIAAGIPSPAAVFASDIGMVAPFITTSCPSGWAPADGGKETALTLTPAFFDILGAWGSGSTYGVAWRNRPDLRGMFVRGWSNTASTDTARVFGSTQTDTFQGHKHLIYSTPWHDSPGGWSGGSWYGDPGWRAELSSDTMLQNANYGTPRISAETRPINMALQYCIKTTDSEVGVMGSSITLVEVSTTAAAQLNPGIWGYFTAGDVSFWFGVLVAIIAIIGFKAGGLR